MHSLSPCQQRFFKINFATCNMQQRQDYFEENLQIWRFLLNFAVMKPAQIFHQYIWIINTLRAYRKLTLEELNQKWIDDGGRKGARPPCAPRPPCALEVPPSSASVAPGSDSRRRAVLKNYAESLQLSELFPIFAP